MWICAGLETNKVTDVTFHNLQEFMEIFNNIHCLKYTKHLNNFNIKTSKSQLKYVCNIDSKITNNKSIAHFFVLELKKSKQKPLN